MAPKTSIWKIGGSVAVRIGLQVDPVVQFDLAGDHAAADVDAVIAIAEVHHANDGAGVHQPDDANADDGVVGGKRGLHLDDAAVVDAVEGCEVS